MYVEYFIIGLLVINTLMAMISVVFSEVDRIYFPAIGCITIVAFMALGLLVGAPIKKMERAGWNKIFRKILWFD